MNWLVENEYLDRVPKIPVPTLPQRLLPILTDADLDTIFRGEQLSGRGLKWQSAIALGCPPYQPRRRPGVR